MIAFITAVGVFIGSLLGNVISPMIKHKLEERKEYKERIRKKDAETYQKILDKLGHILSEWGYDSYVYRTRDIKLSDELNLNREDYRIVDPKGRRLFDVLRERIGKVAHFLTRHSEPRSRGENEIRVIKEGLRPPSPFPAIEAYEQFRNYMDKYTD